MSQIIPTFEPSAYAERSRVSPDPRQRRSDPREPTAGSEYVVDDRELLGIVQVEIDGSLGWQGTRVSEKRRTNLNSYLGNRRGDEVEGRSTSISRVTFEQVEWAMPSFSEVFLSGSEIVRFFGTGKPEDDEKADQATDACNWVWRQSRGFDFLRTVVKDGLIQMNGIGKIWYDRFPGEGAIETYEGKSYVELEALEQDPNFEIRAVTAWQPVDPAKPYGEREEFTIAEVPREALPELLYDVKGLRVNATGRVRLDKIPPEEFIINRDARGLYDDTCRFLGHRIRSSESDLVRWGFDPELVRQLPGSQSVYTTDQDAIVRSSQDDSFPLVYSYRSDSERTIYVTECYVLVDRDGDGVSEWWKVVVAGDYGQALLAAEPVDGHPFVSFTPIPVPHRFYGLSLVDVTKDVQDKETTLERLFFDSLYLSVDPRNVVLTAGEDGAPMVNLEQLLSPLPGGYIEEYEKGALRPYDQRNNAADIVPGFEHLEQVKTRRTGISPDAMGINPEAINKHVYGAMVQQTGAQRRIIQMVREAAEQFVVEAFRLIYKCLLQNHTEPIYMRLRGKWVVADPREWANGYDCEIAVGLGHGSRMERATDAEAVGAILEKLLEGGFGGRLVQEKHIYNAAVLGIETRGFKNTEQFLADPEELPPPEPPEPSPQERALEAQTMIELGKLQVERSKQMLEMKKAEWAHEEEVWKLRIEAASKGVAVEVPMDDPELRAPYMSPPQVSPVPPTRPEENSP